MAKFRKDGKVFEVGSPELNPTLIAGATPVSDSTPLGNIASSNLVDSTPIDFNEPQDFPVFPVADLEVPDLQPTAPEQQAQGFTEQLQELQTRLIGESAFRAEREEEAGLPALLTTQQDLSGRLKALQAEALAIPLRVEQEFRGRASVRQQQGISQQRNREIAIQALGVSSLLEASRGNITLAQDLVDRAVAQQFDPIREEIAVKRANLNLILESPEFTLADKNRARRAMAQESAREREIDEQESNERAVANIAIDVAAQGGEALLLKRIQEQTDPVEAQRIATEEGFTTLEERRIDLATRREERLEEEVVEDEQAGLGYTDNQLRKLRGFGVDPEDTELADTLLFRGEQEFEKLKQQREKELSPSGPFLRGAGRDLFNKLWEGSRGFFGF